MTDSDRAVHRAALALLVAELDGAADAAAPLVLDRPGDPAFAVRVAEHLAELFVDRVIDAEDDRTEEVRAELQQELLHLADDASEG